MNDKEFTGFTIERNLPTGDFRERRVPVEDWTDDEWLAVMRVVPPEADISIGEMAVAELRARGE